MFTLHLMTCGTWQARYASTDDACAPPIMEDPLDLFTVADPGIRPLFTRDGAGPNLVAGARTHTLLLTRGSSAAW